MVGGESADFLRARPLFEAMGKNIVHVGAIGTGQVTKAANQIVVGITIAAVSEALVLGVRGGVPAETLLDVLGTGLAGNRVIAAQARKAAERSVRAWLPCRVAPQGSGYSVGRGP